MNNLETDGAGRLEGVIDLHVHAALRGETRYHDALTLAQSAEQAGMRAVLLKSHFACTVALAQAAQAACPRLRVFGALATNPEAGGLHPAPVAAALRSGAREIWMPSTGAAHNMKIKGIAGAGLSLLDESGRLTGNVQEIVALIAQHNAILGSGHCSLPEIRALVSAARQAGVQRILITHPEQGVVALPLEVQQELQTQGVYFERCFLGTIARSELTGYPLEKVAAAIRGVGVESTILATDLGQRENPLPAEGMRQYLAGLHHLGFSAAEIERMACVNPARFLDF